MEKLTVDSHQHFWQVGLFDYPWMKSEVEVLYRDYLPSGLEPILKANRVARTVLLQASNSIEETRWMLELSDQYAFIAGVVGWVDVKSREVDKQLDELTKHPKFKGVRHLVESEPADDWLTQPKVLSGLRELARYDVSYDLLVHTRHLKHVKTLAEYCPGLRLVIDHLAKPPVASGEMDEWKQEIREVAAYPNVFSKLSGLVTEANWKEWRTEDLRPFVDHALEIFGTERLMFGSDYRVCLLAASYSRVKELFEGLLDGLTGEDKSRIFGENAAGFYRLAPELAHIE